MPEVHIRPATSADIPYLVDIDPNYTSDHVWQMDIQAEEGEVKLSFRQIRLPRSVRVEYPHPSTKLVDDWVNRSGVLVALLENELVGYIGLMQDIAPLTTWVTDLVILRRHRRKGIGSALVLAAQEWAIQKRTSRVVLEMQPKNYPAICMAQKLGYDFCGYHDHYFPNRDVALFFSKSLPWELKPAQPS